MCSAIDRFSDTDYVHKKDHKVEVADLTLLNTLIVHPRIYRAVKNDSLPPVPCTIELTQPHLEVLQGTEGNLATVRMSPYPSGASQHSKHWQICWAKPDCLRVTTYKSGLIDVAQALTEAGMQIPTDGLQQLKKSMPSLSSLLTTYSDCEMPGTRSLIGKEPDNTLHFQLTKTDGELHIALCLYPFGEDGPVVIPGVASQQSAGVTNNADTNTHCETMLANIDDAMFKLSRNLQKEQNIALEVLKNLPVPENLSKFVWQTQTASGVSSL